MTGKPLGRPSIYAPLLRDIRDVENPGEWFIVRRGHQNRSAPSQLRDRYGADGFDFRAVPDGKGKFNIEASWNAPRT